MVSKPARLPSPSPWAWLDVKPMISGAGTAPWQMSSTAWLAAGGPAVPGQPLRRGRPSLPFFVKSVQRHRGVRERATRAHLGCDPDSLHDLLIARARPAG